MLYAKGRKGSASILDTIVKCMRLCHSRGQDSISLKKLSQDVQSNLGFPVPDSSIRATIYRHPQLFVRAKRSRQAYYALSEYTGDKK